MTLRILSYNILEGGKDRLPLIGGVIQQQQPDVVALLEARSRSNVEALAQQLGISLTFGLDWVCCWHGRGYSFFVNKPGTRKR